MIMQGLVAVVGGGGFLGRYAVRALAKAGWRIRVAVRRPHLVPELRVMGDVGQIEIVGADMLRPETLAPVLAGATASVNLVGLLFESGAQTFNAVHKSATATWAQAARAAGVARLVQVSAIGADPKAVSRYAASKGEGEAAARAVFPDAVILRPSIVFGEEDDFFNRFAKMAALSPALPLIGGGATRFQPVYAGDVGEAVVAALRASTAAGVYELGGPSVLTFKALMEQLLAEIRLKRLLAPIPFPVAEALGSVAQLSALVGLPPVLTRDQVELLKVDNVAAGPGLAELGIRATALEAVLPTYLWKYRPDGQFSTP